MNHLVVGLFDNSKNAGDAVAELKEGGFSKEISVVAKDENTAESATTSIQEEVKDGLAAGAATGTMMGIFAGIIAGLASITIPGAGLFVVGGPLLANAAAGAATGALAGGIVGGLVDAGIPQAKAKMYEEHLLTGQVLVAVTVSEDKADLAFATLSKYQAKELQDLQMKE
jgi:uncharacterized membrane protein